MAQLVKRFPEVRGSNTVIGKKLYILNICLKSTMYWKEKNKEIETGNGPSLPTFTIEPKLFRFTKITFGWLPELCGLVYTYHPATPGSNSKHNIYAFFNLYYWNCIEKNMEINKKRPGLAHFFKKRLLLQLKCLPT